MENPEIDQILMLSLVQITHDFSGVERKISRRVQTPTIIVF